MIVASHCSFGTFSTPSDSDPSREGFHCVGEAEQNLHLQLLLGGNIPIRSQKINCQFLIAGGSIEISAIAPSLDDCITVNISTKAAQKR